MNVIELARMTDDEARDYLENLRWPNGPVCPHCKSTNVTKLQGEKHRAGTIQCNHANCRKQFTVTVGSVMEATKISLVKWVLAFHFMCSSKKGMSALQLQRELGLGSYRTAWFLCHRVRMAMDAGEMKGALSGVVECDEAYFGGKPRPKNNEQKRNSKRGRGTSKAPVMVLVQRNGKAKALPIPRVDAKTLKSEIRYTVDEAATIVTDEFASYSGVGKHYMGGHETVNHSAKEYHRFAESGLPVHTNTAECFFSLFKRGFYGTFHQMSKRHLHRYCSEFTFRWNHRKVSDFDRMEAAIKGAPGKRLVYETPS